jgi:hypothetical protein
MRSFLKLFMILGLLIVIVIWRLTFGKVKSGWLERKRKVRASMLMLPTEKEKMIYSRNMTFWMSLVNLTSWMIVIG